MQTYEVRSLLQENVRVINIEEPIVESFQTWYKTFVERAGREPTLIDVFYAGYVLSNPNVRDQYRIIKQKDIKYKK